MEPQTELIQSWNSENAATAEPAGMLNLGVPQPGAGEMKKQTFSLPPPLDDDGTDISLKDWQLGPRNFLERSVEAAAQHPNIKPFKGSMRTRKFTPLEPKLDEDQSPQHPSSPDNSETPTTPRVGSSSGSLSMDHQLYEGSPNGGETGESRKLGGIAFDMCLDEISLNDDASADNNNNNLRAKGSAERGSSLRVSFVDESEMEKAAAPSTPRRRNTSRSAEQKECAKRPTWERSTKIGAQSSAPAVPKAHVQATLHGVRPRKGISAAAVRPAGRGHRVQASALPVPEIGTEMEYQCSNGNGNGIGITSARMGSELHRQVQSLGPRSIDEGGKVMDSSISKSNGESFLIRSNGTRQYDDSAEDEDDQDEDAKVGMLCGGGLSDTKISGDFVRLLGKLCRLSVPLPKQSVAKPASQQGGRKLARSNSTPSWETHSSTMPYQNYAVFGRHDSLKLLSECCSNGPTPPSYSVHKPRKTRDHEPHQHFYKTISKTLDQKLKS